MMADRGPILLWSIVLTICYDMLQDDGATQPSAVEGSSEGNAPFSDRPRRLPSVRM